jgi:N-acetyl-alpha-D-muramate 1-phosphate uridylyltransferase
MRRMSGVGLSKALLPVVGRPFVDHQLELLSSRGVEDVVFCIGLRGDRSPESRRRRRFLRAHRSLRRRGRRPQGHRRALRLALDAGVLDEAFAVLYGDSYLPIDLEPVWHAFAAGGLPALMTVYRNEDRWEPSNAVLEAGRVVLNDKRGRHPRDRECRWIDYGLSVVRAEVIEQGVPPAEVADLADRFHSLSVEGKLAELEVDERFYEVGSPEGLAELEGYLLGRDKT